MTLQELFGVILIGIQVLFGSSEDDPADFVYAPADRTFYSWPPWSGYVYRSSLTDLEPGEYIYRCSADNISYSEPLTFQVEDPTAGADQIWTIGFMADVSDARKE